jgi:hypothetical protein
MVVPDLSLGIISWRDMVSITAVEATAFSGDVTITPAVNPSDDAVPTTGMLVVVSPVLIWTSP